MLSSPSCFANFVCHVGLKLVFTRCIIIAEVD